MVYLAFGAEIWERFPSRFSLSGTFLCQISFSFHFLFSLYLPKSLSVTFCGMGSKSVLFLSPSPTSHSQEGYLCYLWSSLENTSLFWLNIRAGKAPFRSKWWTGISTSFQAQGPPILYNNSIMDAWETHWNFYLAELPTSRNDPKQAYDAFKPIKLTMGPLSLKTSFGPSPETFFNNELQVSFWSGSNMPWATGTAGPCLVSSDHHLQGSLSKIPPMKWWLVKGPYI